MIVKQKEIEIDENDIFHNDVLQREESIKNISELINSYSEPFVLSITANWGAGKTTYVKLLKAYLKKHHHTDSIYFSAWEDDFMKEPLISILGELNSHIKKLEDDLDVNESGKLERIKEKYESFKTVGSKVVKRGFPAFIKGATAGFIDTDAGFEKALSAISEAAAKELVDNYEDEKQITNLFKESLMALLEEVDAEKPLVIFIDELDRCRPSYSIELLERIKHLFGVDRIIFVLSIDKKQLSESIKSLYGDIDTENYLRRFIDIEYKLDNPRIDDYCQFLYIKYDLYRILQTKELNSDTYNIMKPITELSYGLPLSLREIDQLFLSLNIIARTIQHGYTIDTYMNRLDVFYIIAYALILKIKNHDVYELKNFSDILNTLSKQRRMSQIDDIFHDFHSKLYNSYENKEKLRTKWEFAVNKIEFVEKFNLENTIL